MNQQPYYREQASKLLDDGECDMKDLTMQDVANRAAEHEHFALALQKSLKGDNRLLDVIIMEAAATLCRSFDT